MSTTHASISLSSGTATRITPNGIHSGMDITIQNLGDTGYVYIGGAGDLNPENFGYRLSPGLAISFELPGRDALYATTDLSQTYIAVLKTGLEAGH
jgi:hypothetical protein